MADTRVQHFLSNKHILISGAGPASLSFALALHRAWPPALTPPKLTLLERRDEPHGPGGEGYTISIRSDRMSGGMQALQQLGLLQEVRGVSVVAEDGKGEGGFTLWDREWRRVLKFKVPKEPPDGLPCFGVRVARWELRKVLLGALPGDVEVRWENGCEKAERTEDGRVKVELSNGKTMWGDLLVVGDGARSRIRNSLRPEDELRYAGATIISAIAKLPEGVPGPMKKSYGIALGGDGNAAFVSPVDDTSAVWSISRLEVEPRMTLEGARALVRKEEILNEVRERGKIFSEPFGQLVEATEPETLKVFNTMDKMPIDHAELGEVPVVFIGDANHAVSPFAGNGANMALMDGVDLANELINGSDFPAARAAFDKKSITRSKRTVQASRMNIAISHATGWWASLYRVLLHFINFLMSF